MVQGPSKCGARMADKEGHKLHLPFTSFFFRAAMRGEYFSVFLSNLMSQPSSMQKPISTRMRVHCFLLQEIGSEEGVSGTPLA